jgi:hypothetical protein
MKMARPIPNDGPAHSMSPLISLDSAQDLMADGVAVSAV